MNQPEPPPRDGGERPTEVGPETDRDAAVDDGVDWQPHNAGRRLVLAIMATSALITLLLLFPFPDDPRRAVVLGLLVVLFVLQGVLLVRFRRAGRRSMSPMWLRVAAPAGWLWGFFTGFQYAVPIPDYQPALSSALSGAITALLFALFLWIVDSGRRTRTGVRTGETTPHTPEGPGS